MKITSSIFVRFLEKISLTGSEQISECVLDFQKDGVHVQAMNPAGASGTNGWLYASAFKDYQAVGKIGVTDMAQLIKIFKRFGDGMDISKQGALLIISENSRKVEIELMEESFIKAGKINLDMKFEQEFILPAKVIEGIIKDATISKDATIKIEATPGKVKFSNTGKYKFANTVDCPTVKGEASSTFGAPIVDATSQLEGDIVVKMGNVFPIMLIEKNDSMMIHTLVAPFNDSEE